MRKLLVLVFLSASVCISLRAQQTATIASVANLLRQMETAYDTARSLSFKVAYTYTDENDPGQILDSLYGQMQISNNRYHWNISTTEVIADSQYAVMLFKDDKLMYITKPLQKEMRLDPLARLDSALFLIKGLQCSINTQKDITIVNLDFPDSSLYRKISLTIDKKTGFITKTEFIVKAEALKQYGQFDENLKHDDSYAHIEANYSDYSTAIIDDSVFNENSYFQRNGKNFTTVSPFTDYKIFIGSPNL